MNDDPRKLATFVRLRAGDLARSDQHQADGAGAAAGGAVAVAQIAVARAAQRWTARNRPIRGHDSSWRLPRRPRSMRVIRRSAN